jgi:D-glycero-D-manno-heptose 1,7-bisphosphate phosphatase
MNKALFLDRDGVIINYVPYLSKPEQVKIPEGAGQALRQWQDAGYILIILTNQSGIGRGYFSIDDVNLVHSKIFYEYQRFGVYFQEVLMCPHHPSELCICRKPQPFLLIEAAKKHNIDIAQSYFIGDAFSDIECAIQASCQPVLLLTGRGKASLKEAKDCDINLPIFFQLCETVELIKA